MNFLLRPLPLAKKCVLTLRLFTGLSILAGILIFAFLGQFETHKSNRIHTQMVILETALAGFKLDTGRYPGTEENLSALLTRPESLAPELWHGPYVKSLFRDPWGNPYQYVFPSKHGLDFDLYSLGADGQSLSKGDDPDDINNWSAYPEKSYGRNAWESFILFLQLLMMAGFFLLLLGFLLNFVHCIVLLLRQIIKIRN